MKYQNIYGRADTGYKIIKSNDNGVYTEDAKVQKSLYVQLVPPDNCQNNDIPEAFIFLNNIGDKKNIVIGKSSIVQDIRNSMMYHFYIFDGDDSIRLYKEFDNIFKINNFALNMEQAKTFDILNEDIFSDVKIYDQIEILNSFHITKDIFKTLMMSLFDCSVYGSFIYFVNECSDKESVIKNKALVHLLYSYLPWQILERLGFITYFKFISPSRQDTLNANIKLRFIENNLENQNIYDEKEKAGNYIFDLSNDRYTNKSDYIENDSFLEFLYFELENINPKTEVLNFYNYLGKCIDDYSKLSFEFASFVYSFFVYKNTDEIIQFQQLKNSVKYYKYFSDYLKEEYVKFISNNIENIKNTLEHTYSINEFLLDIYNEIDNLKQFVILYFCEENNNYVVSNSRKAFEIENHKNTTKIFVNDLRKNILSNNDYLEASKFLFEKSLEGLFQKQGNSEKIVDIVFLIKEFSDISPNIFEYINMDLYIKKFMMEELLKSDISTFKKYIKELSKYINSNINENIKQNFIYIYCYTSHIYLKNYMEKLKTERQSCQYIIDSFYNTLTIIRENKYEFYDNDFIKYFDNLFFTMFENTIRSDRLDELLYFIEKVDLFCDEDSSAKFMITSYEKILKENLGENENIYDKDLEILSSWPEKYIKKTKNNYLPDRILYLKNSLDDKILEDNKIQDVRVRKNNKPVFSENAIFFMGYLTFSLLVYLINIIVNNQLNLTNIVFTISLNMFSCGLLLATIFILSKQRGKWNVLNIFYFSISIVMVFSNFIIIMKENTGIDIETLNSFKKIYKIKYDLEGPEITILKLFIQDNYTNTSEDIISKQNEEINIENNKNLIFDLQYDDKLSKIKDITVILDGKTTVYYDATTIIRIEMSTLDLGKQKIEIVATDEFLNKSTKIIALNNIDAALTEKIDMSLETKKTTEGSEGATTNLFKNDSTITIQKNEKLNVSVSTVSKKPIEIWFKINDKEELLTLKDDKYEGDFTSENFLTGENNMKVTVKSEYDRESINIKVIKLP